MTIVKGFPFCEETRNTKRQAERLVTQIRNQGCWNLEGTVFVPADQIEKVVIREVTE